MQALEIQGIKMQALLIAMHLFVRFVEFSMLYVSKTIVIILLPYGVTVNADLEPKTHHQTPMTCTYTVKS